jgi:hypothetical protein
VRPLEAHQAELLTPVLPLSTARLSVLERSPALFQYMLSCPIAPFSLYAVERAGQVKGYFLLASAPGQVRIADCWVTSEDPADWRSLLNCIIAEAYKDPQAAELVAWANDPLLAQAMLACGFQRRFEVDVQVLPAPQATLPAAPLRLQLLDNDTAYLHRGTREFWT